MRTLMSGAAWVHYGQIYVQSGEDDNPDMGEYFGGQRNGLCGAVVSGHLFLITGLHTGEVGFTVELYDQPPPADEVWEEIVEASFQPSGEAALVSWGGEQLWPLDLTAASYRVRYCATGMDAAQEQDTAVEELGPDRYLLQLWAAPPGLDRVVRQTSQIAAYWHQFAREQPPPPSVEEKAAAQRRAHAERERAEQRAHLEADRNLWGGRPPSPRLRAAGGNALNVARLNRPVADVLAAADPITQRAVARWVTRRACAEAQLTQIDWIAAALDAMDRGEPLPWPFDGDDRRAWDLLWSDEHVPHTEVTSLDGRHNNLLQQAMAFPALFSAREQDPLTAALDALWNAAVAFGQERYQRLFSEVVETFPLL